MLKRLEFDLRKPVGTLGSVPWDQTHPVMCFTLRGFPSAADEALSDDSEIFLQSLQRISEALLVVPDFSISIMRPLYNTISFRSSFMLPSDTNIWLRSQESSWASWFYFPDM